MTDLNKKIESLRKYFRRKPEISMAFVFGSYAKGRAMSESDFDVAIYFKPAVGKIEWEEGKDYKEEDKIWLDVERIVKRNVDLVILNNVASTIAFEILRTGKPIIIKNKSLYWEFLSRVSFEAIDFRSLIKDYLLIKQRSASLSEKDKVDLLRKLDFLKEELKDLPKFASLDQRVYESDATRRRDVERWTENIVNCSIDIAKILLASEKRRLPNTYKDMLASLSLLSGFDDNIAQKLAGFAKLRNILAHEYLDIRFVQIRKFIDGSEYIYKSLVDFVKKVL